MKELTQPFKIERRQTDNSLDLERGKADDSFEAFKEKTEFQADQSVSENRQEADQARLQRRSQADLKHDNNSQEEGVQRIQEERSSEDSAIQKERSKNDLAIETERGEKDRLLSQLVEREREATDKNLLEERHKTDIEAKRSAKLLQLERAAHMETRSALTTREEFLAIVSHDLRNPIGVILSFAELLSQDPSIQVLSTNAQQGLEIIQRNAKTSLKLIGDILDMERIEGGKFHLELAPQKLTDLVQESMDSYRQIATRKRIQLTADFANVHGRIACDKDRISQVLSNLIGNAVKFTPDGGFVTIKVSETEVDIEVSIQDSGPGIPQDQQTRIFDRFAQLDNKQRQGLGLGLYISKTLIESHNGKIGVLSTQGKGSKFYFTLPKNGTPQDLQHDGAR